MALADIVDLQMYVNQQAEVLAAFAEASQPGMNTWVIGSLTEPKTLGKHKAGCITVSAAAIASRTAALLHSTAKPSPDPRVASTEHQSVAQLAADISRVSGQQQGVSQIQVDASEQEGQVGSHLFACISLSDHMLHPAPVHLNALQ